MYVQYSPHKFETIMENYQAGDLIDIVRAGRSGAAYGGCTPRPTTASDGAVTDWNFSTADPMSFSAVLGEAPERENFGDPFSNMIDPFLHDLNHYVSAASSSLYNNSSSTSEIISVKTTGCADESNGFGRGSTALSISQNLSMEGTEMKRAAGNLFSQMIQMSPNTKLPLSPCASPVMAAASPRGIPPPAMVSSDMINVNSSKTCLVDNTAAQISSPRNPGLKRRKSQAKKVVCIPAPAPSNNRPSGEVVPSDLWAWRKYGQKPIKGSPYPRGYYRCSSSKGCSARKQVERSRTDPNMLVITYTSEHNHPWPTQRNALAGSTRSQQAKNNASSNKNISPSSQSHKPPRPKEERQESSSDPHNNVLSATAGNFKYSTPSVKEENEDAEKQLEMQDAEEFSEGLPYKLSMMDSNQADDFFAELGELEADPINLLFEGFHGDEHKGIKGLDPFNLFDWSGEHDSNNTSLSSRDTEKTRPRNK